MAWVTITKYVLCTSIVALSLQNLRMMRSRTVILKTWINAFVADLDNAPWSLLAMVDDINEKLDTYKWIFSDVMNRHEPIVKKRVKHMLLLLWMNNDILQLMRLREQFKARTKSNILANIMYQRLRNQVVKSTAEVKSAYVRNVIFNNMSNPGKLWKTLKRIAPTKSAPSNFSFIKAEDESICDPTGMANSFNKYLLTSNKTRIRLSRKRTLTSKFIVSLIL